MTALAELQRQFQQHVLTGDDGVVGSIEASPTWPATDRLAIYSDAYRLRLIEALASNFPRLQQWLGADAFAAIARSYIDSHPSHYRSIRWFGAALPACLELSHADQPWLADLAQWEWSLAAAFDARDANPIDETGLAQLPADRWANLRLEFHPSLEPLAMCTNAPAIFKALSGEMDAPEPQVLAYEQTWLIWRRCLQTTYRSLDDVEQRALAVMREGRAFEDMCETLCALCDPAHVPLRAASLLKGWLADGLVIGLRI